MSELEDQGFIVRFIHPYDDRLVIAGQGTLALEMMEQGKSIWVDGNGRKACSAASMEGDQVASNDPPFDLVIAPVGGGGMLSGVSTSVKGWDSRVVVIGAEPESEFQELTFEARLFPLRLLLIWYQRQPDKYLLRLHLNSYTLQKQTTQKGPSNPVNFNLLYLPLLSVMDFWQPFLNLPCLTSRTTSLTSLSSRKKQF